MKTRIIVFGVLISIFIIFNGYAQFEGGSGTKSDPYRISTLEQLQKINNYLDKHFIQTVDIDASATISWNDSLGFDPLGDALIKFTGSYDGNHKKISNLTINRPLEDYVGLFGFIQNTETGNFSVRDLSLESITISGTNYVGGLSGKSESYRITNCSTSGILNSNGNYVGGLIGQATSIVISLSKSSVKVYGNSFVGGLIGHYKGLLYDSHSLGDVTGISNVGGLFGANIVGHTGTRGSIYNVYSTGNVTAINRAGGLAGILRGEVNNLYATGLVNGTDEVGGLSGFNDARVRDSYATGDVTGEVNVGGLAGLNDGSFTFSYSSGNVTGNENIGGLIGENNGHIQEVRRMGLVNDVANDTPTKRIGGVVGLNRGGIAGAVSYANLRGDSLIGGISGYNSGSIERTMSYGDINGISLTGGITGYNSGSIRRSTSLGNINVEDSYSGGVTGTNYGHISNSSAKGIVSGSSQVGGLSGTNLNEGSIRNSFSSVSTIGNTDAGGFVGLNGATITTSYWDSQNSSLSKGVGRGSENGLTSLITEQMVGDSAQFYMESLIFPGEEDNDFNVAYWGLKKSDYPVQLWSVSYFYIEEAQTNSPITSGEALVVNFKIRNFGGIDTTQTVTLLNQNKSVVATSSDIFIEGGDWGGRWAESVISLISSPEQDGDFIYYLATKADTMSLSITLLSKPGNVALLTPAMNDTNIDLKPNFTWRSAALSDSYDLQISLTPTFGDTLINRLNLTDTTFTATLDYLTTYNWRVRGKSEIGNGEWSDTHSFTTIIEKPEVVFLSSPQNEATEVPISSTLSWNHSERAETYNVQISESADFSTLVKDTTNVTLTTFNVASLKYNTFYYWRVKALNAGGESEWSDSFSFFTAYALATPITIAPTQNSSEETQPVRFEWNPVENAIDYTLEVSSDSLFAVKLDLSNTDAASETATKSKSKNWTISQIVNTLEFESRYYWRLRAENQEGISDWTKTNTFTTQKAPIEGKVALDLPINNTVDLSFPISLSWNSFAGANIYDVQLSKSASFDTTIIASGISEEVYMPETTLDTTSYFWRVRASVDDQLTAWSEVWTFKTELRVPEIPFWEPYDGGDNVSKLPLLSWNQSTRAETYHLQLSSNSEFSSLIVDETDIDTTNYQLNDELESNTLYYWHIRAGNQSGFSEWSETLSFKTEITTSNELTNNPIKFTLEQNYPNPFNPTTQISYGIPQASEVELSVFNMLGQKIITLVDSKQSAGWHTTTFDASGLPSGFYIYRIQTGNFVSTKKLMLIK